MAAPSNPATAANPAGAASPASSNGSPVGNGSNNGPTASLNPVIPEPAPENTWVKTGGQSVGINPYQVSQLATSLGNAVFQAGFFTQQMNSLWQKATQLGAVSATLGGTPQADDGALQAFTQDAPRVAKEIQNRLNHFLQCQQDVSKTITVEIGTTDNAHRVPAYAQVHPVIDRSMWFTDAPPPDLTKIQNAIDYFGKNIDLGGSGWLGAWDQSSPARAIYNNWSGAGGNEKTKLSPEELDAVLNALSQSPGTLKMLNYVLDRSNGFPWASADTQLQDDFGTYIAKNAAPGTVNRVAPYLTHLPQLNAVVMGEKLAQIATSIAPGMAAAVNARKKG